jgi:hypothetical protein
MRGQLTLVAMLFLIGLAIADDISETKKKTAITTAKLPAHVAAPVGQLSLFADFKNKGDLGIPLYVVNRTGKTVDLFAYNRQLFLAAEYEAEPEKWKPARVVDYPLCGNSLEALKLANDTYMKVHAYVAPTGFKAKVRYRFDGEATPVSNAGEGMVSHDDLAYLLVSKTTDFAVLSKIAKGEFIPPAESADFRPLAIARMAEAGFEAAKAEAVLESIAEGPDRKHAKLANDALKFMRKFGGK